MSLRIAHLGQAAAALTAIVSLAFLGEGLRARAHGARQAAQRYEDIYYLPPTGWLPVFSFGWDEAVADLIWMRGLVYFGDDMHGGGNVDHVFDYAEAVAELDPDFRAIYHWIGTVGIYRPQRVTPEDVERSVTFMQRGARRFPADGELAWSIGAALAFELVPLLDDEEAQDAARARAAPWLMTAARLGSAPEWGALSNAAILARIGRTDQAARHLEEMYLAVDDPQTRAQLRERIRQLRDHARAEAFVAATEELEAERQASFPYLSPGLYLFVGSRRRADPFQPIREGLPRAFAEPAARSSE